MIKKIFYLLSKKQKKKGIFLLSLMFFSTLLEAAGISAILPVISIILEGRGTIESKEFVAVFDFFGRPNYLHFVVIVLLIVFLIYLLKSLFQTYFVFYQSNYIYNDIKVDLSSRLFAKYMNSSLEFHITSSTSSLIRNVSIEVSLFSNFLIQSVILTSEILVVIVVVVFLFIIQPISTFAIVLLLGLFSYFFYLFFKSRLVNWGNLRQLHEGLRLQTIQEGFGCIKESILYDLSNYFISAHDSNNKISASVEQKLNVSQQIPKIFLELICILGIFIYIILMLSQGLSSSKILQVLSILAFAAFRVLPSANKILNAIQLIKYQKPSVDIIYNEFLISGNSVVKRKNYKESLKFDKAVSLKNVTFSHRGSKRTILNSVSLEIKKGQIIGIIGVSGSGKSTLLDILMGFYKCSGEVMVDGLDINYNIDFWQKKIAYVPQNIFIQEGTLENNIALGDSEKEIDYERLISAINGSQLNKYVSNHKDGTKAFINENGFNMSGGERQRIGIARALYRNPEILILDEATSSLDYATENEFMSIISNLKGKITIIMVAHRVSTLEKCDCIYELKNGNLELINQN